MAGAAGAVFLAVFGYEAGRAGEGRDPALASAPAAAAAQAQPPADSFGGGSYDDDQPQGELAAPTTRQS